MTTKYSYLCRSNDSELVFKILTEARKLQQLSLEGSLEFGSPLDFNLETLTRQGLKKLVLWLDHSESNNRAILTLLEKISAPNLRDFGLKLKTRTETGRNASLPLNYWTRNTGIDSRIATILLKFFQRNNMQHFSTFSFEMTNGSGQSCAMPPDILIPPLSTPTFTEEELKEGFRNLLLVTNCISMQKNAIWRHGHAITNTSYLPFP
jgi:hypothetical protein